MKPVKHLLTACLAAACMLSASITCFADTEKNYVVTTTTGTSAKGSGMVWTQITQQSNTNGLDNNAVNFGITTSTVENNTFTATIEISTKEQLSYAAGSVGYETDHLRLTGSQLLEPAGGALVEDNAEGKYSFQYSNPQGSNYSGGYIQLTFETIGEEKTDQVLFLTVDSVLDVQSQAMNFNKSDGLVSPGASPKVSTDFITVRLAANSKPYTYEELGWTDALNCDLEKSGVAKISENGIVAITPGTVNGKLINKDYSIKKIVVEVYRVDEQGVEHDDPAPADDKTGKAKNAKMPTKKSVNIGVPMLLVIAGAFAWLLARSRIEQQKKFERRRFVRNGSYDPAAYGQKRPMPPQNGSRTQRPAPRPQRNVPRDRNYPPYDM